MTDHTESTCGNTIRIKNVEDDVVELKTVLGEVVKTQTLLAQMEERTLNQKIILSEVASDLKKTESRIGDLERAEYIRKGGKTGLADLGKILLGIAVIGTAIIAFLALAQS